MKLRDFPHTCSSHLLAGFDNFNGLSGDNLNPGGNEATMLTDLLKKMLGDNHIEKASKGYFNVSVSLYHGNFYIFALTTSQQYAGNNFLSKLGFQNIGFRSNYGNLIEKSTNKCNSYETWKCWGKDLWEKDHIGVTMWFIPPTVLSSSLRVLRDNFPTNPEDVKNSSINTDLAMREFFHSSKYATVQDLMNLSKK